MNVFLTLLCLCLLSPRKRVPHPSYLDLAVMLSLGHPIGSSPYPHPCLLLETGIFYISEHNQLVAVNLEISVSQRWWSDFLVCPEQSRLLTNMQMQLFIVYPFVLKFSQFGKYIGSLIIAELYPFLKGEKKKKTRNDQTFPTEWN